MSGGLGLNQIEIDQDLARVLLEEGCFFLLLDMPIGSSIGIDLSDYTAGEKFKGFKMVPPGIHFVHYSAVNSKDHRQVAPRTGFFHCFSKKEIMIKKWDPLNEDISEKNVPEDETERYKANLIGSLDQFLAPYPLNEYKRWRELTFYITDSILNALNPVCGRIKSVTELIPLRYPEDAEPAGSLTKMPKSVEELLPKMKVEPNSQIKFSEIGKSKYPSGSTPSEVTQHSIDSTYALEMVLKRYIKSEDILGELQYAFVTFLVGQVYDSFEHWKALLQLLCSGEKATLKYPNLYCEFVQVLRHQLHQVSEDIFVDIVEQNNFLLAILTNFFYNISLNPSVPSNLKENTLKLKAFVTDKYEWEFDSEPEDEKPVIVEI